ncbi:MAG: maleylpyruvate isomerase family mycothiol-dependent enzyme [Propionibacteriales bacterium]|nr:maleylpyruvate isomerase family mycothiol-dependent enzyme [Propionibacteriales bacterium]
MVDDSILGALQLSDQRAIRTVDSLEDDRWREPSLLPGWTRAHVVAHLALNAEGFARSFEALQDGAQVPTYDSVEGRDADIETLAAAAPSEIRDRYFGATKRLRHLFGSLTEDQWAGSVTRFPGSAGVPIEDVPAARRGEVEIHHADLDAGYTAADWPTDFTRDVLDTVVGDRAASDATPALKVRATDLGQDWHLGADSPVISGPAAALAWWLLGRDDGRGLTSDHDPLPALGPWTRR